MSNAGMKGSVKRKNPEKISGLVTSSGTIPTCENPGATPPGIEPVSHKWEVGSLTGFSQGSPVSPHFHYCAAPYLALPSSVLKTSTEVRTSLTDMMLSDVLARKTIDDEATRNSETRNTSITPATEQSLFAVSSYVLSQTFENSPDHFYIGTKIKLDPVSELGSFDLGSGRCWCDRPLENSRENSRRAEKAAAPSPGNVFVSLAGVFVFRTSCLIRTALATSITALITLITARAPVVTPDQRGAEVIPATRPPTQYPQLPTGPMPDKSRSIIYFGQGCVCRGDLAPHWLMKNFRRCRGYFVGLSGYCKSSIQLIAPLTPLEYLPSQSKWDPPPHGMTCLPTLPSQCTRSPRANAMRGYELSPEETHRRASGRSPAGQTTQCWEHFIILCVHATTDKHQRSYAEGRETAPHHHSTTTEFPSWHYKLRLKPFSG
ncbi:hypothetical protein PR048_000803 [Dryococelus australis]|uniref:Uncharacterized protein n=1 Tax=Dryococelus australis TaxID=614101 RepID=A0ABQ9IFM1_9NEOP|nr:hypothetical protein PR048_000803 [Dryococelus australis]